jgi:hypothetical protein
MQDEQSQLRKTAKFIADVVVGQGALIQQLLPGPGEDELLFIQHHA